MNQKLKQTVIWMNYFFIAAAFMVQILHIISRWNEVTFQETTVLILIYIVLHLTNMQGAK